MGCIVLRAHLPRPEKQVSKLCAKEKGKKVEFCLREITQGSKKKTYGPYLGHIEKLAKPIELKGRVIECKPVALLKPKSSAKKGGVRNNNNTMIEMTNLGPELEKRCKDDTNRALLEEYNRNKKIRNAKSTIKNKAFLARLTEKDINFIKDYELRDMGMGGDNLEMYLSETYGNMNSTRKDELETFVKNLEKKNIRFNKFRRSIS